jgi:peptidoglycan/LPS O-acetylase OafA/YrhL
MSQASGSPATGAGAPPAPAAAPVRAAPGDAGKPVLTPLTSIRFFAALHLLLFHGLGYVVHESGGPAALQEIPGWAVRFMEHGYYSTGLFFLLSGFILTYLYVDTAGRQTVGSRRFWVARLTRIYPLHITVLVLLTPLVIHRPYAGLMQPTLFGLPIPTWAGIAVGGVLSAALMQAWFPEYALSWNYPTWALSVVVFFYLMFPPLVRLLGRLGRGATWALLAAAPFLALAPPAVYLAAVGGSGGPTPGEAFPTFWGEMVARNPLVWLPHFFMGMLLARVFTITRFNPAWAPGPARWRLSWGDAVVALLLPALFLLDDEAVSQLVHFPPYLVLRHGLLAPLYLVLVYDLANNRGVTARLLSLPGLKRLGDASFSMFVLQVPTLVLTGVLFGKVPMHPLVRLALKAACTVAVSLLSVALFEKPVARWLRKRLFERRRTRPPPGLGR